MAAPRPLAFSGRFITAATSYPIRPVTADGVYRMVREHSAELGVEIGAHSLRATAATNALDHQDDIAEVQEWLGACEYVHNADL